MEISLYFNKGENKCQRKLIEEPQNLREGSIGISYYTSNSVYSVKKDW